MSTKSAKNGRLEFGEEDHYPQLRPREARIVDGATLDPLKPFRGQVKITPETAARWLGINLGNRRKRTNFVEFLARQIQSGEWQEDHPQPLVFSDAGRLIDGQHRLFAITEAKVAVVASVVCGVRDQLREYIDLGISRTLEDRVEFDPDPRLNQLIARMTNGWYLTRYTTGQRVCKITPEEARELYAQHQAAIRFGAEILARGVKGMSSVPVAIAFALFFERDSEEARRFVDAFFALPGTCDIQPAAYLRHWIESSPYHGGDAMRREWIAKCTCAFKAAVEGRQVQRLQWSTW